MIDITERTVGLKIKMLPYQHRDPDDKDRRSGDRLIFVIGIPIPGNTVFISALGCVSKNIKGFLNKYNRSVLRAYGNHNLLWDVIHSSTP